MARKQVVEVRCDRCERVEHVPADDAERTVFIRIGQGEGTCFNDLCTPCFKTVKNHLDQVCKKIDGVSPERKVSGQDEIEKFTRAVVEGQKLDSKKKTKVTPLTTGDNNVIPMTAGE